MDDKMKQRLKYFIIVITLALIGYIIYILTKDKDTTGKATTKKALVTNDDKGGTTEEPMDWAMVGGVITGGVFFVILVVVLIIWMRRKGVRTDDDLNKGKGKNGTANTQLGVSSTTATHPIHDPFDGFERGNKFIVIPRPNIGNDDYKTFYTLLEKEKRLEGTGFTNMKEYLDGLQAHGMFVNQFHDVENWLLDLNKNKKQLGESDYLKILSILHHEREHMTPNQQKTLEQLRAETLAKKMRESGLIK